MKRSGCGSARLERSSGGREVGSSNLPIPTLRGFPYESPLFVKITYITALHTPRTLTESPAR